MSADRRDREIEALRERPSRPSEAAPRIDVTLDVVVQHPGFEG